MSPVRLALAGVGGFAQSHLKRLLYEPLMGDDIALVAAADPRLAREKGLRADLEARGCRAFDTLDDLLASDLSLDGVVISTPIPLHREMAAACLDRGLYVLLEKPPVVLLSELQELLAHPHADCVAVSFQRIASPAQQAIKGFIAEGRLGDLRSVTATACWPRNDAYYVRTPWAGRMVHAGRPVFDGPATNAMAHIVHGIMYSGDPTRRGFAVPEIVEAEFYRARPEIEAYDMAALRGTLDSGVSFHLGLVHACAMRLGFAMEITGTRGSLRYDRDGKRLTSSWGFEQAYSIKEEAYYPPLYADFIACIREPGRRPFTTLEDTRGYLVATNAGLISSGGIRTIPAEHVRRIGQGPETVCAPVGIESLIPAMAENHHLFSDAAQPWARPATLIDVHRLDMNRLASYFHGSEAAPQQHVSL